AVLALELRDDRVLQLRDTADVGVLRLAGFDGTDRGKLDVRRRIEVGLTGTETDDVASRRFQRARFIRDRDSRGRLHAGQGGRQNRQHKLLTGRTAWSWLAHKQQDPPTAEQTRPAPKRQPPCTARNQCRAPDPRRTNETLKSSTQPLAKHPK